MKNWLPENETQWGKFWIGVAIAVIIQAVLAVIFRLTIARWWDGLFH